MAVQGSTLIVVSSEPENTRFEDAARARTAPLCPVSVARHLRVLTSHTRTCHIHKLSHAAPSGAHMPLMESMSAFMPSLTAF